MHSGIVACMSVVRKTTRHQISADRWLIWRGEVTVAVSIFSCPYGGKREREIIKETLFGTIFHNSTVLIATVCTVAVRSAQKLGNRQVDCHVPITY